MLELKKLYIHILINLMAQALAGETLQFEAKPQVVKPRPKYRP